MKTLLAWLKRYGIRAPLLTLGLLVSSPASAQTATYNIFFKAGSADPQPCAVGGFTFEKSVAGSFPVTLAATLSGTPCIGMPAGVYMGGINVIVENVTLNGEDQGPNVVGLSGTVANMGNPLDTITFGYTAGTASTPSPDRPLAFVGGSQPVGGYYLYNAAGIGPTAQALPEPGAFGLVLLAFAAVAFASRSRARR